MKTIDISHHNGRIKWQAVSKDVSAVFIKATEGRTYVDPMFIKNAIAATQNGIKVGYYHFATLRTHNAALDAKIEANWFIENIKKAPTPLLPLVLDFEDTEIVLNKTDSLTYINTFFASLVVNGYRDYMLYSGTHFLNDHLPDNHNLGCVPIWIADYNEPHFTPNGWDKITLHQYTDKGKVNGITGNVDLNRYI